MATLGDARILFQSPDLVSLGFVKDASPQLTSAVGRMEIAIEALKEEITFDQWGDALFGNPDPNRVLEPKAQTLYDEAQTARTLARQLFVH